MTRLCHPEGRATDRVAVSIIKALAAIALALAVEYGMTREADAQTTYYTGTASTGAWDTSRWSTSVGGPFTGSFVSGTASRPVFTSGSYSFAGVGASNPTIGDVTVNTGVIVSFTSTANTYTTGGRVQTMDVGSSGVFDMSGNSVSTAAGTGFRKTGAGVFALGGAAYTGGFTLDQGTVIARGVNAMGNGGALTLNGGVVASNATRDLSGRYGGGVTIGGNVQFGEFSTNVALANDTANLTFSNDMSLGAASRTLTLGNRGTVTFGGIISNSSGGITFAAAPGADAGVTSNGRFEVTGTSNTFTGNLTFTGAEVRFANNGSLGNAANNIVINGGRFGITSGTGAIINSARSITVGDAAGTSITSPGTGVLTYDGVIANISGTTGSWSKQGGGTLRLGGASTYTGSTTIGNGTIQLAVGNDRLPTGTILSLGQDASTNRGTLDLGGFNQTVAGLSTIVGLSGTTNIVTTSVGSGTLSVNVTTGSSFTYGDGSTTNSGVISGAVSITKLGAGTQILGGSNSYTGPTTLSAGTLRSGTGTVGNFAFGTGTLALNGGTLTSGTDNTARTFANNVTIGGDVTLGDATATGALAFTGTVSLSGSSRTLTTLQSTTFSGPISNGGLVKAGTAMLTLTGSNSYSGGTIIGGTSNGITITNANALGTGTVQLQTTSTTAGNTVLGINGGFTFANPIAINGAIGRNNIQGTGSNTLSGPISISGSVGAGTSKPIIFTTNSATSSFTITGSLTASSLYAEAISFRTGSHLLTGTVNAPFAFLNTNSGGNLTISSTGNDYNFTQLAGSSTISLGAAGALDAGGRLESVGTGVQTLRLAGFNQGLAGLSSVSGGTATIQNGSASSDSVLTVAVTSGSSFAFAGSLADGGSRTLSLVVNGSGAQTLSGSSSYTGGSTIQSGTLIVGNANALGASTGSLAANGGVLDLGGVGVSVGAFSGSSAAVITSTSAAVLSVSTNATSTFAGSFTGAAGLTKGGTSLLNLTGSSNSTGVFTVNSGTLAVNGVLGSGSVSVAAAAWLQGSGTIGGPVQVDGMLSPGNSPGVLTLGSVTLGPTSNTVIEITGTSRGTTYDGVNITTPGGLTYGGTMSLSFSSLFGNGTTFDIFNFTGLSSGSYSSVVSSGVYSGTWSPLGSGTYQLSSGAQTLTFSQSSGDIIVVPEPATLALAGAGVALAASWARRRRASKAA